MQYWDASALVSLCIDEDDSATLRRLVKAGLVTRSLSAVEIASAIERRRRDGSLTQAEHAAARTGLRDLAAAWTEIAALGPVHDRALRLVATHALRAADAMQLARPWWPSRTVPAGTPSCASTAGFGMPGSARAFTSSQRTRPGVRAVARTG